MSVNEHTNDAGDNATTVFFVHIMKTGGSTVLQSLLQRYPANTRFPQTGVDSMIEAKSSPSKLLSLEPGRREALRWISPHVPLGVARAFQEQVDRPIDTTLLLRDGLGRAVSHLRQVARRFDYAYSYRELLDLPLLGEFFFSNHQARALTTTPGEWQEWEDNFVALGMLEQHLQGNAVATVSTAPAQADLAVALEALRGVDVLGLQGEFDDWWLRCHRAFGWPVQPVAPQNVAAKQESSVAPPIPDDIIDELRERNALDSAIYAAAQAMLGQASG